MPPVPSGDWISYGLSLVPEVSPIYARNYSSDRGSSTQSNEVQSSRRSTGDCRCQFWCQLVLRFGALSCAFVLFLATQSVDSVTSCSSVRFGARTSVGLRVSCPSTHLSDLFEGHRVPSMSSSKLRQQRVKVPSRYLLVGTKSICHLRCFSDPRPSSDSA